MAKRNPKTRKEAQRSPLTAEQRWCAHFLGNALYDPDSERNKQGILEDAEKQFGVTKKTVLEWLKNPEFADKVRDIRGDIFSEFDSLCYDGIRDLMKGYPDAEKPIPPNAAICIWWMKNRHPEVFDENLRRARLLKERSGGDLPAPPSVTWGDSEEVEDPDGGERPDGWNEFTH